MTSPVIFKPEVFDPRRKGDWGAVCGLMQKARSIVDEIDAFMAGAILSYVARKIILKEPLVEGKVIINPDTFFVPWFTAAPAKRDRSEKRNGSRKI